MGTRHAEGPTARVTPTCRYHPCCCHTLLCGSPRRLNKLRGVGNDAPPPTRATSGFLLRPVWSYALCQELKLAVWATALGGARRAAPPS